MQVSDPLASQRLKRPRRGERRVVALLGVGLAAAVLLAAAAPVAPAATTPPATTPAGSDDKPAQKGLSEETIISRANAARDVLVAGGVAPARISTISYGKDRPASLGSNEQAWSQNRRAVTVVR
jgi:hypothetical protein